MNVPTGALRADILARLLLVQSTAGHLQDETSVVEFACRGLEIVPGIDKVRNAPSGEGCEVAGDMTERYPLRFGGSVYGDVLLRLNSRDEYAPYAPHVQNLLYVIGIMLEERRQRRLAQVHQQDLEQRVAERTLQLSHEVLERRAAEERALFAMARAEGYLAISEAIIVELDIAGTVKVINKRGCYVLGYTREQLAGKDWFDAVIPEEQVPFVRASFLRLMTGAASEVEYYDNAVVARNGDIKYIAWHNIIQWSGGQPSGTLSSGVDITERKRSEAALAAEKEQLDVTL